MKKTYIVIAIGLVAATAFFFPKDTISNGFLIPLPGANHIYKCFGISHVRSDVTDAVMMTCYGIPYKTEVDYPEKSAGKLMSIESYVSQNISELSPIKATMGGTFYVTGIKAEGGYGTANYEDGHNAYLADFTYTATDQEGIKITSFVVQK